MKKAKIISISICLIVVCIFSLLSCKIGRQRGSFWVEYEGIGKIQTREAWQIKDYIKEVCIIDNEGNLIGFELSPPDAAKIPSPDSNDTFKVGSFVPLTDHEKEYSIVGITNAGKSETGASFGEFEISVDGKIEHKPFLYLGGKWDYVYIVIWRDDADLDYVKDLANSFIPE